MSEPFLAEIRIVGFNFPPRGWALCDGQPLPIDQNQSLYSLMGTTYGGDGRTTFALPDLRGRTPIHSHESDYARGQKGGEDRHALTVAEMPKHTHQINASKAENGGVVPAGNVLARAGAALYTDQIGTSRGNLAPATISTAGGQAHENMMPFLTLNFCIALQGLFPSRN